MQIFTNLEMKTQVADEPNWGRARVLPVTEHQFQLLLRSVYPVIFIKISKDGIVPYSVDY
jgi:hypothetical protein